MGALLGILLPFVAVLALVIGFWRDPYRPFTTALKAFAILAIGMVVLAASSIGLQR